VLTTLLYNKSITLGLPIVIHLGYSLSIEGFKPSIATLLREAETLMDRDLQATDTTTTQTFVEPSSQTSTRTPTRTQPSSQTPLEPSTDTSIEDLSFPCTRLEAAAALKISDVSVGNRLKNLKKYHAESDLLFDNRITEFGFNAVKLYGDLGKRAYEAQHATDVPTPTAKEVSSDSDRGGELALCDADPFAIVPEIVEDTAPQQYSEYREGWSQLANHAESTTDEIAERMGDGLYQFVQEQVKAGYAIADVVSKVKHQAMMSRMDENDKKFYSKVASTNEKVRGGGKRSDS